MAQIRSELSNFLKTGKCLLTYSFMLEHFKKSSKSKSSDKRLENFGPNWVWVTALKKKLLRKLTNIVLI